MEHVCSNLNEIFLEGVAAYSDLINGDLENDDMDFVDEDYYDYYDIECDSINEDGF
jgi:hypothetical protein